MMINCMKNIYLEIYEEKFIYSRKEDRIKMQMIVYLLIEQGVNLGKYDFTWHNGIPYSIHLDRDLKNCS